MRLEQVSWCESLHADELGGAMGGDPLASISEFAAWVDDGAARLYDVFTDNGVRRGSVLVTAEQANGHNQAVIVAGGGRLTMPELRAVMADLIGMLSGFDSIRTHVQRPALARLWEGLGFTQAEIVMRRING
ncbi:hypothetical protein ACTSKR_09525 [Chitinibacteraceae bacterium HSL-7]